MWRLTTSYFSKRRQFLESPWVTSASSTSLTMMLICKFKKIKTMINNWFRMQSKWELITPSPLPLDTTLAISTRWEISKQDMGINWRKWTSKSTRIKWNWQIRLAVCLSSFLRIIASTSFINKSNWYLMVKIISIHKSQMSSLESKGMKICKMHSEKGKIMPKLKAECQIKRKSKLSRATW